MVDELFPMVCVEYLFDTGGTIARELSRTTLGAPLLKDPAPSSPQDGTSCEVTPDVGVLICRRSPLASVTRFFNLG